MNIFNIQKFNVDFRGAIHCYEMILVHSLDIVLGNKEKLSQVSILTNRKVRVICKSHEEAAGKVVVL